MKYFILEVDSNCVPPNPLNCFGRLDDLTLRKKNQYQIPKRMIFSLQKHMQMVYTDIILHPCFMVSKEAKKIIELYDPFTSFVQILLFDRERKESRSYYIPFLEEVDCLMELSSFNRDKSIIYNAQVDGNKMKEKVLVRVAGVNCICILIRLDLVESMLRRKMIGIGLRDTETVYLEVGRDWK